MTAPLVLRAAHSHIFPGAWLTFDRPPEPPEEVMVAFSDGVEAPARLERMGGPRLMLDVAAHVTARGTPMPARPWLVETLPDDPLRVKVRMSGQ
jgi:hypothetical protein